jgi:hypothetical protein
MRNVVIALTLSMILVANTSLVYAENKSDRLVIPFSAANTGMSNKAYYEFKDEHRANWIISINNYLIYNPSKADANVIIRFLNNFNKDEFLEVGMSSKSNTLWFAVSKEQTGYTVMYRNTNSWFQDRQIMLTYAQGDRLSVNNGQRIIVDRLNIGQFAIKGIEVFSTIDDPTTSNTVGGQIVMDIISGNPLDNPIMSVPFIVTAVVAAVVILLLKTRRREMEEQQV